MSLNTYRYYSKCYWKLVCFQANKVTRNGLLFLTGLNNPIVHLGLKLLTDFLTSSTGKTLPLLWWSRLTSHRLDRCFVLTPKLHLVTINAELFCRCWDRMFIGIFKHLKLSFQAVALPFSSCCHNCFAHVQHVHLLEGERLLEGEHLLIAMGPGPHVY